MCRLWMPGMPKTCRTPSARRASTTHSPPVRITLYRSHHGLEATVDGHFHQRGAVGGQRAAKHVAERRGLVDPDGRHAEGAREGDVVDLGLGDVHAGKDAA